MCGRFTLYTTEGKIKEKFKVKDVPDLPMARYNIAPTQDIVAVRSIEGEREAVTLHWGLIPSWSKEPEIGNRMINARSETVTEKPAYKKAFQKRRCLIPATGFYEWQKTEKGKQPFYFYLTDKDLFAFAGLWEQWKNNEGEVVQSCTILTTKANEILKPVHDRMPVILHESDYDLWLGDDERKQSLRLELLRPFPDEVMKSHAVSKMVNSPSNNGPELIKSLSLKLKAGG